MPYTAKWSNSSNPADAATYGTGLNPTDFAASDEGTVYLHVTDGVDTVTRSFPARYAPGAFSALTNQSFVDDTGNQTYVFSAATGTGLTWTYALTSPPAGVTIDSGTRTITFDTNALAIQSGTTITVTATDQYGRAATGSPRTFTLDITNAPTVTITGLTDGEALEGTHGSITSTSSFGTITGRRWGTTTGGSDLGTGTNPSDFTGTFPGTLYAGIQINGDPTWYEASATVTTDDFVLTVETTGASESFTMRFRNGGTYNGTIDWGDGSSSTITSHDPAVDTDLVHVYAVADTYRIRCRGQFGAPQFGGTADRSKLRTVENYGTIWTWTDHLVAFSNCTGLTSFTFGRTDTSTIANWFAFLNNNPVLSTIDMTGIDMSSTENLEQFASTCPQLVSCNIHEATGLGVMPLLKADEAFFNCPSLVGLDPSGFNIRSIANEGNYQGGFFNFIESPTSLSSTVMDNIFANWAAQLPIITPFNLDLQQGVICDFQNSVGTGAQSAARRALATAGFFIEDGDSAVPEAPATPTLTVLGTDSIRVEWVRPYSDLPITSWHIDYSSNGGSTWTTVTTIAAASRSHDLTGLLSGTEYTIRVRGVSFIGNGTWSSTVAATTSSGATPRTLTSVVVDNITPTSVDVTLTGVDILPSDTFYWVAYDEALAAPSAAQIVAGNDSTGSAAAAAGSDTGSLSFTEITALTAGSYQLAVVVDNGALSNVVESNVFSPISDGIGVWVVGSTFTIAA